MVKALKTCVGNTSLTRGEGNEHWIGIDVLIVIFYQNLEIDWRTADNVQYKPNVILDISSIVCMFNIAYYLYLIV